MEIKIIKKMFNKCGIILSEHSTNIENEIILQKKNTDKFIKYINKYGISGIGNGYAEGIWSCNNLDNIISKLFFNKKLFELFINKEKKYKKRKYTNKIDIHKYNENLITNNKNYIIGGFFNNNIKTRDEAINVRIEYYIKKANISEGMNILCLQKDYNNIGSYIASKTKSLVTIVINSQSENIFLENNQQNINVLNFKQISDFDLISNNKYDRIISINFFESLKKKEYSHYFDECNKKLNGKGYMIITSICKYKNNVFDIEPWFNSVFSEKLNIPIFNDIFEYSKNYFQISSIENYSNSYCNILKKNFEYFKSKTAETQKNKKESDFIIKSIEFYLCTIHILFIFKTMCFCDFYLFKNNTSYNHIELINYNVKETKNTIYKKIKLNSYSEYISLDFCEKMLSQSEKFIFSIILKNYGEQKYINSIVLLLLCKTIQGLNYIFENQKNIDVSKYLENIEDNLIHSPTLNGIEIDIVDIKTIHFAYLQKLYSYLDIKKQKNIISVVKKNIELYSINNHILKHISDINVTKEHINIFSLSGKLILNSILEIITSKKDISNLYKSNGGNIGKLYYKYIYIRKLLQKNILNLKGIRKIIINTLNNVNLHIEYLENFNDENIINFLGSLLIIIIGNLATIYNTGTQKEIDMKMQDNIITSSINIKNIKVWIKYFLQEIIY
jgi:cyclopropane fatty-acyl-phospholipid synthase-like methyltransferase